MIWIILLSIAVDAQDASQTASLEILGNVPTPSGLVSEFQHSPLNERWKMTETLDCTVPNNKSMQPEIYPSLRNLTRGQRSGTVLRKQEKRESAKRTTQCIESRKANILINSTKAPDKCDKCNKDPDVFSEIKVQVQPDLSADLARLSEPERRRLVQNDLFSNRFQVPSYLGSPAWLEKANRERNEAHHSPSGQRSNMEQYEPMPYQRDEYRRVREPPRVGQQEEMWQGQHPWFSEAIQAVPAMGVPFMQQGVQSPRLRQPFLKMPMMGRIPDVQRNADEPMMDNDNTGYNQAESSRVESVAKRYNGQDFSMIAAAPAIPARPADRRFSELSGPPNEQRYRGRGGYLNPYLQHGGRTRVKRQLLKKITEATTEGWHKGMLKRFKPAIGKYTEKPNVQLTKKETNVDDPDYSVPFEIPSHDENDSHEGSKDDENHMDHEHQDDDDDDDDERSGLLKEDGGGGGADSGGGGGADSGGGNDDSGGGGGGGGSTPGGDEDGGGKDGKGDDSECSQSKAANYDRTHNIRTFVTGIFLNPLFWLITIPLLIALILILIAILFIFRLKGPLCSKLTCKPPIPPSPCEPPPHRKYKVILVKYL